MRRTALILALAAGMLAACANTSGEAAGPSSSAEPSAGDQPVASDMVRPVGGDLRIGKTWHLVGTYLGSVVMPPDLTITFEDDTVGGPGPVNSWSATYSASPSGDLVLRDMGSTLIGSSDVALTRAEATYFKLLDAVDGYTAVQGGELYLFDGEANTLVYSVNPPVDDPTAISDETQALAARVVGMKEAAAKAAVEAADHTFRVVARDGGQFVVTEDYSTTRINVTIEKGKVTEATVG